MTESSADYIRRFQVSIQPPPNPSDLAVQIRHFDHILGLCWQRILPTLGRVTVTTVFDRALIRTKTDYPILEKIDVTASGFSLERLPQELSPTDGPMLIKGLTLLGENVVDIITMLTGDILLRQIVNGLEEGRDQ